jgi:hypothetical protein
VSSSSISRIVSRDSVYIGTIDASPVRLKSSSMKSSGTVQKYSWPGSEQNHEIQDMTEEEETEPEDCESMELLSLSSFN